MHPGPVESFSNFVRGSVDLEGLRSAGAPPVRQRRDIDLMHGCLEMK